MPDHPENDDKIEPTGGRRKPLLVAAGVIAAIVLLVVLHLTGVAPRH